MTSQTLVYRLAKPLVEETHAHGTDKVSTAHRTQNKNSRIGVLLLLLLGSRGVLLGGRGSLGSGGSGSGGESLGVGKVLLDLTLSAKLANGTVKNEKERKESECE